MEKDALEELKNLKGKKAIVLVVGGGSMKRQGFLDSAVRLPERRLAWKLQLIEGVEPDPVC